MDLEHKKFCLFISKDQCVRFSGNVVANKF